MGLGRRQAEHGKVLGLKLQLCYWGCTLNLRVLAKPGLASWQSGLEESRPHFLVADLTHHVMGRLGGHAVTVSHNQGVGLKLPSSSKTTCLLDVDDDFSQAAFLDSLELLIQDGEVLGIHGYLWGCATGDRRNLGGLDGLIYFGGVHVGRRLQQLYIQLTSEVHAILEGERSVILASLSHVWLPVIQAVMHITDCLPGEFIELFAPRTLSGLNGDEVAIFSGAVVNNL